MGYALVPSQTCDIASTIAKHRGTTALTALCDVPSRAAAHVKLRSSVTARKAIRSLISSRRIHTF